MVAKVKLKPYRGRITSWFIIAAKDGKSFRIRGIHIDRPDGKVALKETSTVIKYNLVTGEIETLTSRYKLVSEPYLGTSLPGTIK